MNAKALIESGKTALGIELGQTRIKGVLIDLKGRVLAAYLIDQKEDEKLEDYLDNRIFCEFSGETTEPDAEDKKGFDTFMERYKAGLEIEKKAIETMNW